MITTTMFIIVFRYIHPPCCGKDGHIAVGVFRRQGNTNLVESRTSVISILTMIAASISDLEIDNIVRRWIAPSVAYVP